jgi:hypothetical protein
MLKNIMQQQQYKTDSHQTSNIEKGKDHGKDHHRQPREHVADLFKSLSCLVYFIFSYCSS